MINILAKSFIGALVLATCSLAAAETYIFRVSATGLRAPAAAPEEPPPPTHNYATWDPAAKGNTLVLTGANLGAYSTSSWMSARATVGKATGKWYWETTIDAEGFGSIGIGSEEYNLNSNLGGSQVSAGMSISRMLGGHGVTSGTNATPAALNSVLFLNGDVASMLLDMDSKTWTAWRNGVPLNDGVPVATGLSGTMFPSISQYPLYGGGALITTTNFGATPFKYSPPAGYNVGVW